MLRGAAVCMHRIRVLHLPPSSQENRRERTKISSSPREMWILVAAVSSWACSELPVFTVHTQIGMRGDGLSEQINRKG